MRQILDGRGIEAVWMPQVAEEQRLDRLLVVFKHVLNGQWVANAGFNAEGFEVTEIRHTQVTYTINGTTMCKVGQLHRK